MNIESVPNNPVDVCFDTAQIELLRDVFRHIFVNLSTPPEEVGSFMTDFKLTFDNPDGYYFINSMPDYLACVAKIYEYLRLFAERGEKRMEDNIVIHQANIFRGDRIISVESTKVVKTEGLQLPNLILLSTTPITAGARPPGVDDIVIYNDSSTTEKSHNYTESTNNL